MTLIIVLRTHNHFQISCQNQEGPGNEKSSGFIGKLFRNSVRIPLSISTLTLNPYIVNL